jgi:foldase protein PrsA
MKNAARTALSACALIAAGATLSACGGVPGNAVAEVDGTPIERDSFEHWMRIAAKAGSRPDGRVPRQGTDEYDALRDQVLGQLVSHEWIRGQAEEMGLEVSDSEVRESYDQQREQSFPKDRDFRRFLRDTGQSEQDLLLQVRLDLLATMIQEKVIEDAEDVTGDQIEAFYEENRERFAQPERRDLRIVLTRGRDRAVQARRALENGASWRAVARRYSIDEATSTKAGRLRDQAEGTLEERLDVAVFDAERGEISDPVKTQFGHYVFEVEKVQKASQQTLEQARETIRQTLVSQNQQQAIEDFAEDFREKWRERTECRDGFVTPSCSNGPRPTPTPTAPAAPSPGDPAPTPGAPG